jgi:hypothetical protein
MVILAAIQSYAGNAVTRNNFSYQVMARDTPYLAMVQISPIGKTDTPYLSFSIQPQMVYEQVNRLLKHQRGFFQVVITFVNKEGILVSEDEYYIDN